MKALLMDTGDEFSLDERILERIAVLICGDDTTPQRRAGYQLEQFFRAAGLSVPDYEGYRLDWTQEQLSYHRDDPGALRKIVLRLADHREYLDDDDTREYVVAELNQLLAVEGHRIEYQQGRPVLVAHGEADRVTMSAPAELTASLTAIVNDATFAAQLRARLDEAYTCWQSGAPTAATIMLGSVLEGVLYNVAVARHTGGPAPTDHLQTLIATAGERGWIGRDVAEYADVLRNHRNLVHPKKQWTQSYSPEDDLVRIAWNVVVAALNDLAAPAKSSSG